MADKKKTNEPINIQNSLLSKRSSLCSCGIFLLCIKKYINGVIENRETKKPIIILVAIPGSVKECTEESPKIPVLVKKVEYNIKANVKKQKI